MAGFPMNQSLFYHPEVRAYVLTWKGETVDLSRDIVAGSVTRLVDSASVWQLELNNKNKKYTGKLSRMDRIVIFLKRTRWVQVMAGYVTTVPSVDLFPSTCVITGQCTLKRILHTWWDPKLPASGELLIQKALDQPDAGLGQMLIDLLTKVGTWDRSMVHVQQIPPEFKEMVEKYMPKQDPAENKQRIIDKIAPGYTGGSDAAGGDAAVGGDGEVISGEGPRKENLHAHVYRAKEMTFKKFPAVKTIGGWRASSKVSTSDHPKGLALDIMVPVRSALGDQVADWYLRNFKGFHVKYVIWKQRINRGSGWKGMSDRGSITDNHYDHVHVSFVPYTGPGRAAPTAGGGGNVQGGPAGLNSYLYALRSHESGKVGGNYRATNPYSSASGAYQYLDSTWANYGGYRRAKDAPPAVQDKRAAADASRVYAKYKNWDAVSTVHFTGHYVAPGSAEWNRSPGRGNPTVAQYVAAVNKYMPGGSKGGGNTGGAGGSSGGAQGGGAGGGAGGGTPSAPSAAPASGQARTDAFVAALKQLSGAGYQIGENLALTGKRAAPGVHTKNSYHYRGGGSEAADINTAPGTSSGEQAKLKLAANWLYAQGFRTILMYPNHYNHLHTDTGPKKALGYQPSESGPFPEGLGAPGTAPAGGEDPGAAGGGGTNDTPEIVFNALYTLPNDPGDGLLNTIPDRAMIDDRPLMETIQGVCKSGMRSFMSGPNGDFIAFFPDYFGMYKSAPKLKLENIEMKDVHITASDDEFTTHVFTAGDTDAVGGVTIFDWMNTSGVVTIEQEFVLGQLVNAVESEGTKLDKDTIYKKYGARPYSVALPTIRSSEFEFFQALQIFMQKWSAQYSTSVSFTFMPELFPGMRILLNAHDISVYVEQVTHTFSYERGFETQARISCPSSIKGTVPGLPFIGEGDDKKKTTPKTGTTKGGGNTSTPTPTPDD